ncbi:MAG: hypothetical protein MZW92_35315 [Comamonadaceae bacterium]|nr:hypothetical protein [Comamonadaceae bacterium]
MHRFLTTALAALASTLATAALAQNISIATGGTGGVYYPHGRRHRRRCCPSTCPACRPPPK